MLILSCVMYKLDMCYIGKKNHLLLLTLPTIILSITTPNFVLKILKAFLLGDMDSTPPPQTFFFKKWKIIDFKKIELPLLNRAVETTFFFKRIGKQLYYFSKTWKTNYYCQTIFFSKIKIPDIHASPHNIKWLLPKLCVKKKKKCYTYLLHLSTCKHNLVSFFRPNHILTVELHRSFLYIFFSRENARF